jgi:hypothetical protein
MDNAEPKNNAAHGATVEDLQRVMRARKYRFCAAEYSQLAEGANVMPDVRNRYLKIAQYYRELADAEGAGSGEGESAASAAGGPAVQDQPP